MQGGAGVAWAVDPAAVDWVALHALLTICYAPMAGRIDPPSSMATMTAGDLADRATSETLVLGSAGGAPVACAFLAQAGDALELGKIAVAPTHRRCGLLRAMLGIAEGLARQWDCAHLQLHVRVQLHENRVIYRRLGFVAVAAHCHPGFAHTTSLVLRRPVGPHDGGFGAPA